MGRLLTNYILLSASSKHVLPDISSRVSFALTTLLKVSIIVCIFMGKKNVYLLKMINFRIQKQLMRWTY